MIPAFMNLAINGIENLFISKWIEDFFIRYKEECRIDHYKDYDNGLTKRVMQFQHEVEAVITEANNSAINAYFIKLKGEVEGMKTIDKTFIREVAEKHNIDYDNRQKEPSEDLSGIRFWDPQRANHLISMEYFDEYYTYVMKHVENFIGTAEHFIKQYDAGEIKPNIKDFLSMPELIVEGDYDVRYITRYLELTGQEGMLEHFSLIDGKGKDNLARIINYFRDFKHEISYCRKLMLYDCDVGKANDEIINDFIEVRRIPNIAGHRIQIGIENLFPDAIIDRCIQESIPDLLTSAIREGVPMTLVKRERKKRLCNWLCENGNGVDFVNFSPFLPMIAQFIKTKD